MTEIQTAEASLLGVELEVEVGFKPRHSNMGGKHAKWILDSSLNTYLSQQLLYQSLRYGINSMFYEVRETASVLMFGSRKGR